MRSLVRPLALAFVLGAGGPVLPDPTGAILTGVIRDARSGQPLPGATVTIDDLARHARSGDDGHYVLDRLPAGPHDLRVRLLGYRSRSLHALLPAEGELALDVALEPVPVPMARVDVRAPIEVPGLHGDDRQDGADLELPIAAVRQHPLLAEPDAFHALVGADATLDPEAPSGVHVHGGPAEQTAFLLDGLPVLHPHHAAGLTSAWNPDALASLRLWSAGSASAHPHALSGTVEGTTRPPGPELRAQGALSSTQARIAVHGPLGRHGAGFLAAFRSAMHDVFRPSDEASYLGDDAGDALARFEAPWAGGRLVLLASANDNEIAAAADPESVSAPRGHRFDWSNHTIGLAWTRSSPATDLRLTAWRARGDVFARWIGESGATEASSRRFDAGAQARWQRRAARAWTRAELRLEHVATRYAVAADGARAAGLLDRESVLPILTTSAGHARAVSRVLEVEAGGSLALARGDPQGGAHTRLAWRPHAAWSVTGRARHARQFVQSLRNPESLTAVVFPVDLPLAGEAAKIPVARGTTGALEAEWRPAAGFRLAADAFARRADDVVLVAPRAGGPFATTAFVTGKLEARGASLGAAFRTARLGAMVNLSVEHVRFAHGDSTYVPQHAAARRLQGGVIVFPAATASVRLGVLAADGRHATAARGNFEWESCNLLDRGCEFAGRPEQAAEPLGGERLPAYVRVDLGVHKHWHIGLGAREAVVAAFATWSNVLNRANVLTRLRAPDGTLDDIEMRPSGPLVVGLDAKF